MKDIQNSTVDGIRCLAKGTMIRMADGSCQPIMNIRPGDLVWEAKEMRYQRVMDIIMGMENELTMITCKNGKTISLTSSHPVQTAEGMTAAGELAAGCLVVMEDGEKIEVDSVATVPYSDRVYNIQMEEQALISADGFVVGDFKTCTEFVSSRRGHRQDLDEEILRMMEEMKNKFR